MTKVRGSFSQLLSPGIHAAFANILNLGFSSSLGTQEMARAYLTYELLDEATGEGAYKLKLEDKPYNFKKTIKPFVDFIKSIIPSSDRTYDPNTFEWHYHEKYHDIIEKALKGAQFQVTYVVAKKDFEELRRKQKEFEQKAGQSFSSRTIPVEQDLKNFEKLLKNAGVLVLNGSLSALDKIGATALWKRALRFYHPDLHPERAAEASQLNEVWSRLKEGYYIK